MDATAWVPAAIVALALLDTTLSGFRAAAGCDGRIDKRAYYTSAMARGFGYGALLVATMGAATLAVVLGARDGAAIFSDLVGVGLRMLPVFAAFGGLVLVALAVYAVSRHEVRTLATVAILGPFTLARPWVIAAASVWGAAGARHLASVLLCLAASTGVLLAERRLGEHFKPRRPPKSPAEDEPPPADDAIYEVPIEDSIDLHFFAPRDVLSVVDEYLAEASKKGLREVRIIHGRGKGVQRARVQKLLARHPRVASYRSDGTGSTLAVLTAPQRKHKPLGKSGRVV
ncbi:MAG: Smr/MutS family protein [Polyangiaceae bacterium]